MCCSRRKAERRARKHAAVEAGFALLTSKMGHLNVNDRYLTNQYQGTSFPEKQQETFTTPPVPSRSPLHEMYSQTTGTAPPKFEAPPSYESSVPAISRNADTYTTEDKKDDKNFTEQPHFDPATSLEVRRVTIPEMHDNLNQSAAKTDGALFHVNETASSSTSSLADRAVDPNCGAGVTTVPQIDAPWHAYAAQVNNGRYCKSGLWHLERERSCRPCRGAYAGCGRQAPAQMAVAVVAGEWWTVKGGKYGRKAVKWHRRREHRGCGPKRSAEGCWCRQAGVPRTGCCGEY